ncbi:hypothetical protein HG536_0D02880 [Torulaspora globosa]|uniref:THO complex subunit 2 n=1 Tax=Torulaspora globosa TaxID=48254 RepID=A0A7G3ZGY0_9SACH|nr:uncharacterized protein HG536_0D02880 [Torulaspora globosa]QLL32766.1 hypothetical protein HG536_0D02880 [Torulaspora globosa]
MSLSATLDRLSSKCRTQSKAKQFFNEELLNDWASKSEQLCDRFRELEGNDERVAWLRQMFMELLDLFQETQLPAKITLPQISRFIESICSSTSATVGSQELTSMVGKMFVSVSNQYIEEDDAKTVALARISNSLSREVFKFSRLSSKLMNSEQTTLLRHLLKKSKYELKKFNLLAECPTGYSQLVTLLLTAYYDPDNMEKIKLYVQQMYHIAGKYSLDSMRCLDVILNISSEFITEQHTFLIAFLRSTKFWPKHHVADPFRTDGLNRGGNMVASNVIAFHLAQQTGDLNLKYVDMVCILIRNGFINVLSIWENIRPDNKTLEQFFSDFTSEMEKNSMKGLLNPLAMAAALKSDDESTESKTRPVTEDEDDEGKKSSQDAGKQKEKTEESDKVVLESAKMKFIERLLVHGCVTAAFFLINSQSGFMNVESQIPKLITRIFDHIIDPLYNSLVLFALNTAVGSLPLTIQENGILSHKPRLVREDKTHDPFPTLSLRNRAVFYYPQWTSNIPVVDSVEDLFQKSHEYLSLIGARLAVNPQLISKICRIGKVDITKHSACLDKWVNYVRKFIFQCIPLLDINPVVTSEIYGLMRLFPFERRYFLYNEMLSKHSKDVLPIKVGFNRTEREAKSILKALNIDTIDEQSRILANLASTNPLATLMPAVKQIENYDKISELVVSTTTLFNDFACDVLQYVLLMRLTDNRNAVQSDGVNQSMWVQRLSVFIAGLAKECDKMDITNIKEYIVKTLHNGSVIAVSILRELISTVGGIRDLNNVNLKQLKMLHSGEPLRKVARKLIFDCRDDNQAQGTKLIRYFNSENTLSEVIILLHNLNLKANSQQGHYKVLSARCDEMNTLLWSFIELIKHCLKTEDFAKSVLPLDVLGNEYHVSTPWIFHLWRDYIDSHEETDKNVALMIERAEFKDVDFSNLSREVFVNFWKLSLYDIQFDKTLYDERKFVLEAELSTLTSIKKKSEVSNNIKDLLVSCISHQRKFNSTKQLLQQQPRDWIHETTYDSIYSFFQYCVIPRVLFSPSDAIYAASFILLAFEVSDFMKLMDVFVRSEVLSSLLFCCTGSEAGNLGIFFAQLLEETERMRRDEEQDRAACRVLYEWHNIITEQVILTLQNKNYMSVRNGIEFMKHLSSLFPVIDTHIQLLCQTVEDNLEQEEREDIKLPSNALLGHLKARLKGALKLEEFCDLNVEERAAKLNLEVELEEIRLHEVQVANEKKQTELRKQLEFNKKQREHAEKAKEAAEAENLPSRTTEGTSIIRSESPLTASLDTHQSQSGSWPLGRVFRFMDELRHNFSNNNLSKAVSCIFDPEEKTAIQDLTKQAMPLKDFQKNLQTIVNRFLISLVRSPENSDFVKKLEEVTQSINCVTRDASKKRSDMYSDVPSRYEQPKIRSRYGGSGRTDIQTETALGSNAKDTRKPGNGPSREARTSPPEAGRSESVGARPPNRNGSSTGSEASRYYSNRRNRDSRSEREYRSRGPKKEDQTGRPPSTSLASRALVFPGKPAQRADTRNARKSAPSFNSGTQERSERQLPVAPDTAEGRPPKRFRPDDNRSNYRSSDNGAKSSRKDADRPRYADRRNQALPQGPRASQEPPSRYQR